MKKILLSLGAVAAVAAPVAVVVSCGHKDENIKFTAATQYQTTDAFATAVSAQLKDKDVTKGVTFSFGDKSFSTTEGKYITALTKADVATPAAFTVWIKKMQGDYNLLNDFITNTYNKSGATADSKAQAILDQVTAHPTFAKTFGFKAEPTNATQTQKDAVKSANEAAANSGISLFNKIVDVFKALDVQALTPIK